MFYCSMLRQHIQFTCKIQLKLLPAKRLMYPRLTSGDMRLKQFLPKQPQSPFLSDVTTARVVGAASSPLYVFLSPAKWQGSRSGHVLPRCPTPSTSPSHHVISSGRDNGASIQFRNYRCRQNHVRKMFRHVHSTQPRTMFETLLPRPLMNVFYWPYSWNSSRSK